MHHFSIFLFGAVILFSSPVFIKAQESILFQPHEVAQMGSGILTTIGWKPDGDQIVVGTNQSLWLLSNELQDPSQIDISNISNISWSPDGGLIALGRWDGFVEIRNATNWEINLEFQVSTSPIQNIKWSPVNQEIAIVGTRDASVSVWDVSNGNQLYELGDAAYGTVRAFDWSPDANQMVTGYLEGSIHIWDIPTQQSILEFTQHPVFIADVVWQPHGDLIASSGVEAGSSGTPTNTAILVWNAKSGEVIHSLRSEQWSMTSPLAWSPDGQTLAGTSQSGSQLFDYEFSTSIRIWDVESGNLINEWDVLQDNQIVQLIWQPGGDTIAYRKALRRQNQMHTICGDEFVGTLDVNTGNNFSFRTEGHTSEIDTLAWDSNSEYVASGGADRIIQIWDASSGEEVGTLEGNQCRNSILNWNPRSNLLASYSTDDNVRVWDVSSHEVLFETNFNIWFTNPNSQNLIWNPTGEYLAAVNHEGNVKIWNVGGAIETSNIQTNSGTAAFASLAWTSTDILLAIAYLPNNEVQIWRIEDEPTLITSITNAGNAVYSGAWSPNANYLALYTSDGQILIWDVQEDRLVSSIQSDFDFIPQLTWNSEGNRLIANQMVYDIDNGRLITTISIQGYHFSISPNDLFLANVVSGNVIQVWDIEDLP